MLASLRESFSVRRNLRALVRRPADNLKVVDGFRALSILAVMCVHGMTELGYLVPSDFFAKFSTTLVGHLFLQGELGVDVFFVISGLLVTHFLLREHTDSNKISLSNFYYRRALRLLPAYYLVLAFYCLTKQPNWQNVWANLIYINNYIPAARECMPWAWSLAIEEQFYILFPILLIGFLRMKSRAGKIVAVSSLAAMAFALRLHALKRSGLALPFAVPSVGPDAELHLAKVFDALYFPIHVRFGALLCGAIVAYLLHAGIAQRLFQPSRWRGYAIQVIGIIFIGIVIYTSRLVMPQTDYLGKALLESRIYNGTYLVAYHYVFSMGIAMQLMVMLCHEGFSLPARILGHPIWYPLAQLSYSAYLINNLLLAIMEDSLTPKVATSLSAVGYVLSSALLTLSAAAVVYIFVEKPFMQLRKGRRTKST